MRERERGVGNGEKGRERGRKVGGWWERELWRDGRNVRGKGRRERERDRSTNIMIDINKTMCCRL